MSEGEYFYKTIADFAISAIDPDSSTINKKDNLTFQGDFAVWLGEIDSDAPSRSVKHIIGSGICSAAFDEDTKVVKFITAQSYLQEKGSYWSSVFEIDPTGGLTISYNETLGDTTNRHDPADNTFEFISDSSMDLANYFYAAEFSPVSATGNQNNIMFFAMPALNIY